MANDEMKKIKPILDKIMSENGIPDTWYFIGGASEDSVCFEKKGKKYQVYILNRGQKTEFFEYKDLKEAVMAFFDHFAFSVRKRKRIFDEFCKNYGQVKDLETLAHILKDANYDDMEFSFDGYVEEAMCLQQVDDTYEVYAAFRGRKDDLTVHKDFYEAVNVFLQELCCDDDEAAALYDKFRENAF